MGKFIKKTIVATALIVAGVAATAAGNPFLGQMLIATGVSMEIGAVTNLLLPTKSPVSQTGRLNVTADPGAARKAVLGQTAMNTDLLYYAATGTDDEYAHYIIATAAHEIEGYDEIWIEDRYAWSAQTGVSGTFNGYLEVQTRQGASGQTAIPITGTTWDGTCKLTGCSYVYLKAKRTGNDNTAESPLAGGLPGRLTITGRGAKLYDPRLDSTRGGSGSHRADDQTTWGTESGRDNTALQILWYMIGWKVGGKLSVGCGVPIDRIDFDSFIAAANVCDEAISLAAGGTQARYASAGVASDGEDRFSIIQHLLTACNGSLRDSDGQISLNIFKNDLASPVLAFDDDDILNEFSWNQTSGLDNAFNVCRGQYVDPSTNSLYQTVDYPPIRLTSPDGIERGMSLDLAYVQEGRRAQRIAKQALMRAQFRGTFSAVFKLKALGCAIGDIVTVTFAPLNFSSKLFRVISMKSAADGRIELSMIEEDASIYAWNMNEQAITAPTTPTQYDPLKSPLVLAAAEAIAAANEAIATADGKIETFYQTTAPTTAGIGDIWFDTDDGNKMYRYNGTSFVTVQDTKIGDAITAAAGAQATADGKVTTFYSTSTPTAEGVGDLWYNSTTGVLQRWSGSAWVETTTRNVSRGAWASGTTYVVGDIVSYSGSSYTCVTGHTASGGNTPPNATYWNLLAQKGADGTGGRPPVSVQITAIGNSTAIGIGTISGDSITAEAYFNYIDLTGGATCTLKIQYSTNGSSWSDLTATESGTGNVGEPINLSTDGIYTNSSGGPLFVQFRAVTTKTGAGSGTISSSFLRA